MWTARSAAVVGLLLAGCVPGDHPPWLIDHPTAWGIVASVIQPGPYASDLVVPDGQVRAAALPLDTLELQWLVAAPPDTPPLPPPLWIVCTDACPAELRFDSAPLAPGCPDPLPLSRDQPCRLGSGERIDLTLGGAFTAGPDISGVIRVLAVGSADPDLSPETCLERLSTDPYADLQRCLVQYRVLELGPPWKLADIAPAAAGQVFVDIPADARDEPADVHPGLLGVDVVRSGPAGTITVFVGDGDTVTVRAGERITIRPVFAEGAEQAYYRPIPARDDPFRYTFEPADERLDVRVALSELVDDFDYEFSDLGRVRSFTVPDDPAPTTVHLYVTDGRQGRAHATLHLVPGAPDDAP